MTTPVSEWISKTEKLIEGATPGPWGLETGKDYDKRITFLDHDYDYPSEKFTSYLGRREVTTGSINFWEHDAQFIADARTSMPTALKLIKYYREALMHSVRHFEPGHVCLFSCRNGIIIKEALEYFPESE